MVLIITLVLSLIFVPWPWNVFVISVALVYELATMIFGIGYSRRRRPQVGVQTMVGAEAQAITALEPSGQVKVDGEIWEARAPEGARAGETVRIKRVDGLTLEVEPASRS
jgi:membrane-bound serine protease (ClpP class)